MAKKEAQSITEPAKFSVLVGGQIYVSAMNAIITLPANLV